MVVPTYWYNLGSAGYVDSYILSENGHISSHFKLMCPVDIAANMLAHRDINATNKSKTDIAIFHKWPNTSRKWAKVRHWYFSCWLSITTVKVVLNRLSQALTLAHLTLATHFKWSREWIFFVLPCPPTQLRDRPNIVAVLAGVEFYQAR